DLVLPGGLSENPNIGKQLGLVELARILRDRFLQVLATWPCFDEANDFLRRDLAIALRNDILDDDLWGHSLCEASHASQERPHQPCGGAHPQADAVRRFHRSVPAVE